MKTTEMTAEMAIMRLSNYCEENGYECVTQDPTADRLNTIIEVNTSKKIADQYSISKPYGSTRVTISDGSLIEVIYDADLLKDGEIYDPGEISDPTREFVPRGTTISLPHNRRR